MTTCTITFSAVDTALQVKPNSTLIFEPSPRVIRGVGAQVMTPDSQRVVSDASGAGSIALVPGNYRLSMDTSGGSRQVDITVPATPTALLGDLIDTPLGEYEFSALQELRADVTAAAGQVALDRGVVASDRVLSEAARVAAVAAAPITTDAAAQALVYRDQAALYAGSFGPGMILHRPDEAIPAGWWDTGLRQSATSEWWGNTATLALISNWSTASLYTGGIATSFFDFSTTSREFQDVLGTALTVAGQSVAMVRDAISPQTFGPELVLNGGFIDSTEWTIGAGWSIAGGVATKVIGSGTNIRQANNVAITAGRVYRVRADVTVTAGTLTPVFFNSASQVISQGTAISASGSSTQFLVAPANAARIGFLNNTAFEGTVDNASLQEVLGMVAIQPSASVRGRWASWPINRPRRNMLLWSEDMSNTGGWSAIAATVAAAGTLLGYPMWQVRTADDVPTANYLGRVQQSFSLATGQYTLTSIQCANADGLIVIVLTASAPASVGGGGSGSKPAVFNTATATWATQGLGTGATYAAENLGSGLWKITLTVTVTSAGTVFVQRAVDQSSVAGVSGGRTVLLGPAQFEAGAAATPYQLVRSSDEYYEAGYRNRGMWRPDFVDDSLTFTLPAAVDGELILLGRDGSWRETRLAAAGTQMVIGGTGAGTLATPGILRATGPLVAMGFRQGALTADEWLRLKRRWRAEGARGELIAGANLILNGTFDADVSSWASFGDGTISWQSGALRVLNNTPFSAGSSPLAQQGFSTVAGRPHLATVTLAGASVAPGLIGVSAGSGNTNRELGERGLGGVAGVYRLAFVASSATTFIKLMSASLVAGAWCDFDNVTVQPLTPEW